MAFTDVIVTWHVEDGYVTGGRPMKSRIPRSEWDEAETPEEKERLAEEWVCTDFREYVTYRIESVDE